MLQDYTMHIHHVQDEKPVEVKEEEYGSFFSDEIYVIDLQGRKHRYVLTWMGPKLNPQEITKTSNYMDIITNYENSNAITRCRVRRGHEEESLLSLFPDGFITYCGKRIPIHDKLHSIKENGAMFRI